ncbi:hypothetical protein KUW15_07640 [Qipengyuania aquimaris]|uniref:hypothetical protein n=1 Tax=Qipengyuania aquimaris TaxID=255984 RepID=UPI001C9542C9|nr:hypothetical protein [Qipengyuania aquimaris]MBY6128582.1 hypothetical protein [Qipengyuania aquimaris]
MIKKTLGRIMAGAGVMAMVATPMVANAGTRAADAEVVSVQPVKMSAVSRASEGAESRSEAGGTATIVAIIAAVAVIIGIIAAVDDDDDDLSPGS